MQIEATKRYHWWHWCHLHDMHVQPIRNRRSSHNRLSKNLTPNNRLSPTLSRNNNAVFVFFSIVVCVSLSIALFLKPRSSKLEQRNFRFVKNHVIASPQNWGRKFWNQNWKMKIVTNIFHLKSLKIQSYQEFYNQF